LFVDTIETVSTSNRTNVARGKINSPDTEIHDLSLSWFGTGTPIKSVGVKPFFLWAQTVGHQLGHFRKKKSVVKIE
jgi:hypothetical protein